MTDRPSDRPGNEDGHRPDGEGERDRENVASTVCPRCSVGCHLRPREDDATSRARGVAGPTNPNGRLCRNGISAFDVVNRDDRLQNPKIRQNGEFRAVTWERALEAVVERFGRVVDDSGPDALAFLGAPHCTTEENYLLQKLARALGTNNVDNRARLCHVATARALSERVGWPATTNGFADVGEADLILVAGADPARRQPVAFDSFVRPAVTDGTTLVHVDPVGNRTTRLADVHLAPRPGTDALVFRLLSAEVTDAGGRDRTFVDERTSGFEAFAAELEALDSERAASVAGVDPETVATVMEAVVDADRVAAMVGTGVENGRESDRDSDRGSDDPAVTASDALLDLLLLTGNLGRRGTGLFVLRGLVNEQGATDAGCVPDRLPGHQPVTDAGVRERVAAEWGVEPPAAPGETATDLLASFGDGVQGALVVGENPAVSKYDDDWIRERLDTLDSLVVLDVAPSETTRHADVVLPAAAGVEKAGTVTSLDRHVQRFHPTAEPPGKARPDWQILADLGRRLLDDPALFEYETVGSVFDEFARVAPTHTDLSYADLDAGGRQWPVDHGDEGGSGNDGVLYRERFETPDGRALFSSGSPQVQSVSTDGLQLVTGGRASDFAHDDPADRRVRIHPTDADERGIEDDDAVVVSNDDAAVEVRGTRDEDVRRGSVYLHAAVADPLLRSDGETVVVELADPV